MKSRNQYMANDINCLIDTNIWVDLLDQGSIRHKDDVKIFEKLQADSAKIFTSPTIIAECLHVFYKIWKGKGMPNFHIKLSLVLSSIYRVPGLLCLEEPKQSFQYQDVIRLMA